MCNSILQKYLFFFILALSSCRQSATKSYPDVSDIALDVKIERFDKEFSVLQPDEIMVRNALFQEQYPYFYTDYMFEMLEVGSPQDTLLMKAVVPHVLRRKEFVDLNKAVQAVYPDMKEQERKLTQSVKYIKYYFPEYEVPRFISFVGGFSFQIPVGQDYVGIGLDMFLGADSPFYPALIKSIPRYISQRFTPENLVPRVIEAILKEDIYPQMDGNTHTLGHMIYHGKVLYAMDCLLENVDDELKIGYTVDQMKWARSYQQDVWAWFVQENLLYNTDYLRIQKYFTEAPFTPELGENNESAPKLGAYIGWMIVRKYMERHPDMGLVELLAEHDAQKILEQSKFKGK